MAAAIASPRRPPAVCGAFQSKRPDKAAGASAAIHARSWARYSAISGPRSRSIDVLLLIAADSLAWSLGSNGEVLERDVPVRPRLLRQAEHPLADDPPLDLVGAARDRRAG